MPYSSSLSDKEWEIIEPLLPQKQKTRPPIWTKRQILDGIFYRTTVVDKTRELGHVYGSDDNEQELDDVCAKKTNEG